MSSRCWFTANRRGEAQHVTNTMAALVYKCHIDTWAPFLDACSCLTHGLLTFVSEQPSSRLTWKKRFAAADRRGQILHRHKDVRFNWFGLLQFNRSDCVGLEKDSTCSGELINWRYGRRRQLYRWDLSEQRPMCKICVFKCTCCLCKQSDATEVTWLLLRGLWSLPLINCLGHSHYSAFHRLSSMSSQFKPVK